MIFIGFVQDQRVKSLVVQVVVETLQLIAILVHLHKHLLLIQRRIRQIVTKMKVFISFYINGEYIDTFIHS